MGKLIFSRNTPPKETLSAAHPCFKDSGFQEDDFLLTVRRLTPVDRARIAAHGKQVRDTLPEGEEGDAMYNTVFSALVFESQVEDWEGFNEDIGNGESEEVRCTPENRAFIAQASPRLAACVANWVYGPEGEGVRRESPDPLKVAEGKTAAGLVKIL